MLRIAMSSACLMLAGVAYADAPLPPKEAPLRMTLPPGFRATLFAGEPDVVQPIAFTFDDRGRMWVAECYSYPNWIKDGSAGRDRILIFDDTDGDGRFDTRKVFHSKLANVSGIAYGFGGAWVCAIPNVLFIPDRDGDDVPDGPPEVVLDGWSMEAKHNVFSSLTWGPDGWLYGCNGIIATSRVGAPGTPDAERVPLNCGVWRYHPTKKKFEAVAWGTTNPWGLDFDEHGEMFITNCVIHHLWHVVPGAHFQRMYGEDLNPHVYSLLPSICDHIHWGGGAWTSSRGGQGVHSAAGGGHAHVGCMVYLGDAFPEQYRNGVFMCNLHGSRINHDILERNGSTYVARHANDFMLANDPWFRGIAVHQGPDGGVYVSDWTDTGECHNYKVADQGSGRIFKISFDAKKLDPRPRKPTRWHELAPPQRDLSKWKDESLVSVQTDRNEWLVRHSRRILQERAQQRDIDAGAVKLLRNLFTRGSVPVRLRVVWTLHAIKQLRHDDLLRLLTDQSEEVRAWAVRLLLDDRNLSEPAFAAAAFAAKDQSPLVRLHLAGALQLLKIDPKASNEGKSPLSRRNEVLARLTRRHEDSRDPYLPLMYWYAAGPDPAREVFLQARIPLLREFSARRWSEQGRHEEALLAVRDSHDPAVQRDVLRGVYDGLGGRRNLPRPARWEELFPLLMDSPLPEVRQHALALGVQFGDERAFKVLLAVVPDRAQPAVARASALKTLVLQQKPELARILIDLLDDEALRRPAIRALAAYDHPEAAGHLLRAYSKLSADERGDIIQTLTARSRYALALLDAVDKQGVPRGDINSYTIRQLQALKSPEVASKLTKVWGEIRPAAADKTKSIARYKEELKPNVLKKANLANGRALYVKACASCHRLFGEGSDIGPDITGAQRTNLDYVLENVLDPSAIVPREFQVTVVTTTTGRTLSGVVKQETAAALTLQTQNEVVLVPKSDIESQTATKLSMMPEGLLEPLRLEEVRDLIAYLASPTQVPLAKQ